MFLFKKRYAFLAAVIAGLGYASQNYTISGWQHLQLQSISSDATNARDTSAAHGDRLIADRNAWTLGYGAQQPSGQANYRTNSSLPSTMPNNSAPIAGLPTGSSRALPSTSRSGVPDNARLVAANPIPNRAGVPVVRVGSFNLQSFGESKINKLAVVEVIARLIRQFDVVALQNIRSRQQDTIPLLLDKVNQSDRHYDYCIGPRVGSDEQQQQFAFVFDTDRIETDRYQLYTVDDPQNLLEYDPLVAWFRSRMAPVDVAFTFTMVNVRIEPQNAEREVKLLPDLMRSIKQDGRAEDDILLVGDFGCSDRKLGLMRSLGMIFALEGVSTTVAGDEMLDNILFPVRATDEFSGRSGAIDFLRQLNLSPDQAFQVSNHMPVWAEFFAIEGGQPGYVAK